MTKRSKYLNRILILLWLVVSLMMYIMNNQVVFGISLFLCLALSILDVVLWKLAGSQIGVNISTRSFIRDKTSNNNRNMLLTYSFKNKSLIPIVSGYAHALISNITTGETNHLTIPISLGPKSKTMKKFKFSEKYCGCITVEIKEIISCDLLGLFSKSIDIKTEKTFYIEPKTKTLDIDVTDFDSFDIESYEYSSSKKGDDPGETFSIKEYEAGDNPKAIHWKLSSKLDDPVIREYSFPIDNSIMVMLNKCTYEKEYSAETKNDMVEQFVSLSNQLAERGMVHTVGWYDHKCKSFVTFDVSDPEDIWNYVPVVLNSGFEKDKMTTPYHYIEQLEGKIYANYVYVSDDDNDVDKLEELGAVTVYSSK